MKAVCGSGREGAGPFYPIKNGSAVPAFEHDLGHTAAEQRQHYNVFTLAFRAVYVFKALIEHQ
jgi:hypothetical protein